MLENYFLLIVKKIYWVIIIKINCYSISKCSYFLKVYKDAHLKLY